MPGSFDAQLKSDGQSIRRPSEGQPQFCTGQLSRPPPTGLWCQQTRPCNGWIRQTKRKWHQFHFIWLCVRNPTLPIDLQTTSPVVCVFFFFLLWLFLMSQIRQSGVSNERIVVTATKIWTKPFLPAPPIPSPLPSTNLPCFDWAFSFCLYSLPSDLFFLFSGAGHDSTANLIGFALSLLSSHPQVASRVSAEVTAVLEAKKKGGAQRQARSKESLDLDDLLGTSYDLIEESDLRKMKILGNVVKETMRLFPSGAIFDRVAVRDTSVAGINIPAFTTLLFSPFSLGRHPSYWKEPEKFDPDRFESSSVRYNNKAFLPFGAGGRSCVGSLFAVQQAKVIIAQIMRHLKLDVKEAKGRKWPWSKTFMNATQEGTDPALPESALHFTLRPKNRLDATVLPSN